jgi:hypothetical protein
MNPRRLCKYSNIFFNEIYNSELQVMEMPVILSMATDRVEYYRLLFGRDLAPQALRMLAVAEGFEYGDCSIYTHEDDYIESEGDQKESSGQVAEHVPKKPAPHEQSVCHSSRTHAGDGDNV